MKIYYADPHDKVIKDELECLTSLSYEHFLPTVQMKLAILSNKVDKKVHIVQLSNGSIVVGYRKELTKYLFYHVYTDMYVYGAIEYHYNRFNRLPLASDILIKDGIRDFALYLTNTTNLPKHKFP